jgi:hypothetical protein
VNDPLERLGGVHPDGHGSTHAARLKKSTNYKMGVPSPTAGIGTGSKTPEVEVTVVAKCYTSKQLFIQIIKAVGETKGLKRQ